MCCKYVKNLTNYVQIHIIENMDRFEKYRKSEKGRASLKERTQRYLSTEKGQQTRKAWVEANRTKINEAQRKYKYTNPTSILLTAAKRRAKLKGWEFDITKEDLIVPDKCPILNIPIFSSDEKHCANSPSIDRIDSSKGYIKGNVQILSYRANMLKNNGTLEEFKLLVKFLEEA